MSLRSILYDSINLKMGHENGERVRKVETKET